MDDKESTAADKTRAYIICSIYVILALLLGTMLFWIWPPIPWPVPEAKENGLLVQLQKRVECENDKKETNESTNTTAADNANRSVAQPAAGAGTEANNSPGGQNSAGAKTNGEASAQPGTAPAPNAGGGAQSGKPAAQPPAGGEKPPPASDEKSQNASAQSKQSPTPDTSGEIIILPMQLPLGLTLNGKKCVETTFDERLLLLVIVAGMLGAFVHGATSLADYIGNNRFKGTWTWFYVFRPGVGMALALVFYFVIRGGFLSTTGGAQDINPYGIAALAGMVGMFSKQATDKLGEVFSTLFRSAGDAQRKDPLANGAVTLKLEPASVVAGGEAFKLTVSGAGFVEGAVINVDDVAQTTTFESPTKLSAEIAKETIATAKTLKISVVNKDQTKFGPVDFTVSVANGVQPPPPPGETPPPPGGEGGAVNTATTEEASAAAEKPVDGEGGDDDLIDGCEVDMKADTPDEDLPITKGGMQ